MAEMLSRSQATDTALRALRKPQGITAGRLQEITGWGFRPSNSFFVNLARRHGFAYTRRQNQEGVLLHRFVAPGQKKAARREEPAPTPKKKPTKGKGRKS